MSNKPKLDPTSRDRTAVASACGPLLKFGLRHLNAEDSFFHRWQFVPGCTGDVGDFATQLFGLLRKRKCANRYIPDYYKHKTDFAL